MKEVNRFLLQTLRNIISLMPVSEKHQQLLVVSEFSFLAKSFRYLCHGYCYCKTGCRGRPSKCDWLVPPNYFGYVLKSLQFTKKIALLYKCI